MKVFLFLMEFLSSVFEVMFELLQIRRIEMGRGVRKVDETQEVTRTISLLGGVF